MIVINRYYFYFTNKLSILIPIWMIFYILKIEFILVIIILYILFKSVYYYIFCKDFIIEKDKIVLLSSKFETYNFDNIEKIVFVEKYLPFYGSQKIEIFFSDGLKKIINCDGLNSDDEYDDSFYNKYEYIKNVFEKTYLHDCVCL